MWALSSEYWQNLTTFNPSTALTLVQAHSKSLLSGALASTLLPLPYIFYTAARGIPGIYKSDGVPSLAQNTTNLPILCTESADVLTMSNKAP